MIDQLSKIKAVLLEERDNVSSLRDELEKVSKAAEISAKMAAEAWENRAVGRRTLSAAIKLSCQSAVAAEAVGKASDALQNAKSRYRVAKRVALASGVSIEPDFTLL